MSDVSLDFNALSVFLTVIFAVLKLTGVITWSWWIVFLPLIAVYSFGAIVLLIAALWFLVYLTFKK